MTNSAIFTPFTINSVEFKRLILSSSVGGRMSNYDATVTDVWRNFEKRFADGRISGIISTTFHVNKDRVSPLQYPSIADQRFVPYLYLQSRLPCLTPEMNFLRSISVR
jgi:2,4-dienoyl-CoA reductase-like NADH-dependent reductase (Old Yellow Enzyme family)